MMSGGDFETPLTVSIGAYGITRFIINEPANYYANGQQVRGYHMVNVALHCACSILVAVVARRVMRITAIHACLAAMLFAAHPVHTEAVSSIVGRAEVLCCLFFLLSFLCYHRRHRFYASGYGFYKGSFPEFSEMDNPASFSSRRTT
ncbi:hypothetical protein MTO96_032177, partial [Rhipicephalus appendiculatus]